VRRGSSKPLVSGTSYAACPGAEALLLGLMDGLFGVVIGMGISGAVGETFIRDSGGTGSASYPVTEIVAYVVLAAVAET
jgi:ABC-type antimicrobial peptide transport system permease subunit